jgi:hypothetical protein
MGPLVRHRPTSFAGGLIERGIPHSTVSGEFRPEGQNCTIALLLSDKVEDGTVGRA